MTTFEAFEHSLQQVLVRFRNPSYQPPELLYPIIGHLSEHNLEAVQKAILQTIELLKPVSADTSTKQRSQRYYEVLNYRYVQKLTQEETAERLGITPRHVRREQQQAVNALATLFWEKRLGKTPSVLKDALKEEPKQESITWRSQVREELASLQQSSPGSVVEVAPTLRGVMKIGQALASQNGTSLQIEPFESDVTVSMHPSALRQVLITAIEKLVQSISSGQVSLVVEQIENRVCLLITGTPAATEYPPDSDLIREILAVHGGSVAAFLEEDQVGFRIELLSADKLTVLVIDDNPDLVHFYRRYTTGTRYHIVHLADSQQVWETIRDVTPHLIVLDVMLPYTDGWELLTDFREQPATKTIPIIICSVVRREELALSLGASLYLPKPVGRRQFVEALDQVLNLVPVKG